MNNTEKNSKQWLKQMLLSEMRAVVVSSCKYKTCLALINEIVMCINSKFMGWGNVCSQQNPSNSCSSH